MENNVQSFSAWCLLELMGRNKIAGLVTEKVVAGHGFLQVDVPETKLQPAFTRLISPSSLYAINPIDEKTARIYAENLNEKPIEAWDIHKFMEKVEQNKMLNGGPVSEVEYEEEEDTDH